MSLERGFRGGITKRSVYSLILRARRFSEQYRHTPARIDDVEVTAQQRVAGPLSSETGAAGPFCQLAGEVDGWALCGAAPTPHRPGRSEIEGEADAGEAADRGVGLDDALPQVPLVAGGILAAGDVLHVEVEGQLGGPEAPAAIHPKIDGIERW